MIIKKSYFLFFLSSFSVSVSFYLMLDSSNNPDYYAYERIFNEASPIADWEPGYNFINYLFRMLVPDFEIFRFSVLALYSLSFLILFTHIKRLGGINPSITSSLLFGILIGVLSFEFITIRMRTGLMISLINFALVFYSYRFILFKAFAFILVAIALTVHLFSSITLVFYLLVALGFRMLKLRLGFLSAFVFSLVSFFFFYFVLAQYAIEHRSDWLSDLNIYRLLYIAVLPLLIYFFFIIAFPLIRPKVDRDCFVVVFFVACFSIILIYLFDFASLAGEALVRVHTFLAYPFLIAVLLHSRIDHKLNVALFILLNFIVLVRSIALW